MCDMNAIDQTEPHVIFTCKEENGLRVKRHNASEIFKKESNMVSEMIKVYHGEHKIHIKSQFPIYMVKFLDDTINLIVNHFMGAKELCEKKYATDAEWRECVLFNVELVPSKYYYPKLCDFYQRAKVAADFFDLMHVKWFLHHLIVEILAPEIPEDPKRTTVCFPFNPTLMHDEVYGIY